MKNLNISKKAKSLGIVNRNEKKVMKKLQSILKKNYNSKVSKSLSLSIK